MTNLKFCLPVNSAKVEVTIIPFVFPGPVAPRTVCKVGLPLPGAALQGELALPDPEKVDMLGRKSVMGVQW